MYEKVTHPACKTHVFSNFMTATGFTSWKGACEDEVNGILGEITTSSTRHRFILYSDKHLVLQIHKQSQSRALFSLPQSTHRVKNITPPNVSFNFETCADYHKPFFFSLNLTEERRLWTLMMSTPGFFAEVMKTKDSSLMNTWY